MNAILEQINSTGKIFVEFALPMLVQSGVLILILLLTDFALRKKVRAVFRYWIWLLVLLKLVLPTSLSTPLSLGYFFGDQLAYVDRTETTTETAQIAPGIVTPMIDSPRTEAGSDTSAIAPTTPTIESVVAKPVNTLVVSATPLSWQGAVFLAWLTVVMAMGLLLLQRAIFVRGLVAQAKEANGLMADTLESCRGSMGVKRKIGLKVSANATSPAVCGLFRPVILVPQNLTSSLSKSQLRAVLLHELAHIRRGDLWVNLAQTFLQIIYFYNPLLWLANCIIRRVREQAVDEMVLVAMGEKARQYPQALVEVAKLAFKRPALSLRLIGAVESKSALAGRIKHILNRPMPKRAKLGILGLAVVIITAAILLPMATCTPGPPSLVIKGKVKDAQTGKPIAGARVFDDGYGPKPDWEQIKANERSEWGAITNTTGEYSFLTWPEHHSIKVEAPGYKAERRSLYSGHFVFNKKDEEIFEFALEPEKILESSVFKKALPNGVTVELIGICEHPSDGKQWWRPDGSLLTGSPSDKIDVGGFRTKKNEASYEIVAKLAGPETLLSRSSTSEKWEIPQARKVGLGKSGMVNDKNGVPCLRATTAIVKNGLEKIDIEFGLAGVWEKKLTISSNESSKQKIQDTGVVINPPYEKDSNATITIKIPNKIDSKMAINITAVLKNGKVIDCAVWNRNSKIRFMRSTDNYEFHGVNLSDVDHFEIYTSKYQWVKFKNVSLKPNFKTDVQIDGFLAEVIESEKVSEPSEFKTKLPNGVTVELIGVCEHPSQGKRWWRPDGSKLGQRPFEKLYQQIYAKREFYELALKIENPENRKLSIIGKGNHIFNLYSDKIWGGYVLSEGKKMLNQSIGIAQGPWKTIAEANPMHTQSFGDIAFGKAFESDFEGIGVAVGVTVTHTIYKEKVDYRVIAVDHKSNIHTSSGRSGMGNSSWMQTTVHFKDLQIDEIKEFQFQTRPYQWVEFRNVSLRPEYKTDVQVESDLPIKTGSPTAIKRAEREKEPKQGFTAVLSGGVTVELVGICEHPSDGKQWWRPDGQTITKPYERLNYTERSEDSNLYEVVYRLLGSAPNWL